MKVKEISEKEKSTTESQLIEKKTNKEIQKLKSKLTMEQEKILAERKKIADFWIELKPNRRKKVVEIEKQALLKEIKENHRHVCSCSVCGRKRGIIDKEIERLFNEYCLELQSRASKQDEKLQIQLERIRLKLQKQQQTNQNLKDSIKLLENEDQTSSMKIQINDKTLEIKESSFILKQQISKLDDYDGIEISKDDYLSWNFSKNLIIQNGMITVREDWLDQNGENILDLLQRLEQIEKREEFKMYPSVHHSRIEKSDSDSGNDDETCHDSEEENDDEEEEEDEEDDEADEENEQYQEEKRWRESRRMFRLYTAKLLFRAVVLAYREKVALEMQQALIAEEQKEKNKKKKQKNNKKKNEKKKNEKKKPEIQEEEEVEEEEEVKENVSQVQLIEEKEITLITNQSFEKTVGFEKKRSLFDNTDFLGKEINWLSFK